MNGVSIIITVRNGELYIKSCLESIIRQDFHDYEVIIFNDGSTDGTSDKLSEFSNFKKFKVITSNAVGRGVALNTGLNYSTKKYIAILDADDFVADKWLSEMVGILEADKSIDILSCLPEYEIKKMNLNMSSQFKDVINLTHDKFIFKNPVNHSGVIIKKSAIDNLNGYDQLRKSLFDYDLWRRALFAGLKICRINEKLVYKRIHKNQSFENKKRLEYLTGCLIIRLSLAMKFNLAYIIVAILVFLYGFLPKNIRFIANKYL
ncbi:MAG: hypothetical protein RLY43_743 [Bacteroidota bacterium]|jgi:glycosyltransferase involved in cell wall biosynthesis